jgi:hypothetical protein
VRDLFGRIVQEAHLRDPADTRDRVRMAALQLVEPMQQPRAHLVQMPADVFTEEHVERRARGRERDTFRGQRR